MTEKDTKKHPNSRIVTLFRAGSFLSRSQGPGVDDFFMASKQPLGSYFESENSQKVGSGLSFKEEELLLPKIIDVPADDKEFRKKVTEFFADISTPVPHGRGAQLEIGLEQDNDKAVSKDNWPLKLLDYIRYRHAMGHPWVAASKEDSDGDSTKHYYIFDKSNVQVKNSKKVRELDAAMAIYLKVKNNMGTVDQMLLLLGVDIRSFSGKQKDDLKIERLRELVDEKPGAFTEAYGDGDIEISSSIKAMILTGVLKEIGTRIVDSETDTLMGNTMEEVIWWFKDDDNSDKVIVLKARLQETMARTPAANRQKTVIAK